MLLRLSAVLAVAILAVASGYANYLHVAAMGGSAILLVVGGELLKLILLPVAYSHFTESRPIPFLISIGIWLVVVAFSFANTFGNALMRNALEQGRIERAAESKTRPVLTIRREMAELPPCNAKKKAARELCIDARTDKLETLKIELELAEKRTDRENRESYLNGDPVKKGIVKLADMAGIVVREDQTFILVAILWTLLAEIGSAFGGLIIPIKPE
jgi:hypothetical protein